MYGRYEPAPAPGERPAGLCQHGRPSIVRFEANLYNDRFYDVMGCLDCLAGIRGRVRNTPQLWDGQAWVDLQPA